MSKILERLFKRLGQLALFSALATGLAGGIASHYHFKPPGFWVCLWALLLLEIGGHIWRGGLPSITEDKP